MMILVPVQYLPGDKQDANHVRVENHHKLGLTYSTVMIDGWKGPRQVRAVSSPDRPRHPNSYLVHLVPAQKPPAPVLHCRNVPDIEVLRYVEQHRRWPTIAVYNAIASAFSTPAVTKRLEPDCRLIQRKQRSLVRKELVHQSVLMENANESTSVQLTTKGQQRLEQSRA